MADTFNQNHSGGGNNVINIVRPQFDLTVDIMERVAAALNPNEPVLVGSSNFGRSPDLATRLRNFLTAKGYRMEGSMTGGVQGGNKSLPGPVTVHPDGLFGGMVGGKVQAVYIDVSLAWCEA